MPPAKKDVRPRRARTPQFVKNQRGVKSWKEVSPWLEWRGIEDIECITPDQAGVARGKMMPSKKFTSNTSLALPSAPFMMTISGDYPEDGKGFAYSGDSQVLDFQGDSLLSAGAEPGVFRVTLSSAELTAYRERFPAHLDADRFDLQP